MTADEFVERGLEATRNADCAAAVEAFKQTLDLDPNRPAIWKQLGDRLADLGEAQASSTAFLKCLSLELDKAAAEHGLGTVIPSLLGAGSGYVAEPQPLTKLGQPANTTDNFIRQGYLATQQGRSTDALEAFRQALILDPGLPAIWKQLGDRLADQGEAQGALTAFLKCLSLEIDRVAAEHGLRTVVPSFLGGGSGYVGDIDPSTMHARSRGIFVTSMPKAGTVYVANSLCRGLGKVNLAMNTGGIFPNIQIPQGAIERLLETGAVYVPHCDANRYNLIELSAKLDRMVIHVRDPRQGLVAWANFVPSLVAHQDRALLEHYEIPADLFSRPFGEQLDWHIEHYMPVQVNWIQGWMDADQDPSFKTRLLFVTNERLGSDPEGYFRDILAFHEIPESLFTFPARPTSGEFNFREGRSDEWMEVMTPAQRDRIDAMVPAAMKQKFGWI